MLLNCNLYFKKVILTASYGRNSCVKLWDIETFECLKEFSVQNNQITCLDISANKTDIQKLIVGTSTGYIYIFDLYSRKKLDSYKVHKDSINSVCIISEQHFASCSVDKKIVVYNFETLGPCERLIGHINSVTDIDSISPEKLVSCSKDCSIRIWNILKGVCLKIITGSYEFKSIKVISEELISVVSTQVIHGPLTVLNNKTNTISVWNITTGKLENEFLPKDYFSYDIKFYNLNRSVCLENDNLKILETSTKKRLNELKTGKTWFLQKLSKNTVITCGSNFAKLWDVERGNLLKCLNHKHNVDYIEIF